jgi:hypothetical protein
VEHKKISCRAPSLGSTMGLDSSGRFDGERRMAVANALGQRGLKSVTAAPWKSPMMATVCNDSGGPTTRDLTRPNLPLFCDIFIVSEQIGAFPASDDCSSNARLA